MITFAHVTSAIPNSVMLLDVLTGVGILHALVIPIVMKTSNAFTLSKRDSIVVNELSAIVQPMPLRALAHSIACESLSIELINAFLPAGGGIIVALRLNENPLQFD